MYFGFFVFFFPSVVKYKILSFNVCFCFVFFFPQRSQQLQQWTVCRDSDGAAEAQEVEAPTAKSHRQLFNKITTVVAVIRQNDFVNSQKSSRALHRYHHPEKHHHLQSLASPILRLPRLLRPRNKRVSNRVNKLFRLTNLK